MACNRCNKKRQFGGVEEVVVGSPVVRNRAGVYLSGVSSHLGSSSLNAISANDYAKAQNEAVEVLRKAKVFQRWAVANGLLGRQPFPDGKLTGSLASFQGTLFGGAVLQWARDTVPNVIKGNVIGQGLTEAELAALGSWQNKATGKPGRAMADGTCVDEDHFANAAPTAVCCDDKGANCDQKCLSTYGSFCMVGTVRVFVPNNAACMSFGSDAALAQAYTTALKQTLATKPGYQPPTPPPGGDGSNPPPPITTTGGSNMTTGLIIAGVAAAALLILKR